MFPFLRRPISAEPWAGQSSANDIISPYGYSGPFAWGAPDVELFWTKFDQWAATANVVSAFVRLPLFSDQQMAFAGDIEVKGLSIVRMLEMDAQAIWMDYEHKVRKNVGKAQRSGVHVEIDRIGSGLDKFIAIYHQTMERRDAASTYFFNKAFFQHALRKLPAQFAFFHACHEGSIVSSELVAISANYIYSFLGGTLSEAFSLRPNDLLKHTIIEWGREQRKKAFVLGGGYRSQDGIFRYKRSFAPRGEVPFKVGRRIYDSRTYEELVEMRRLWETKRGNDWSPYPGFFPAYRA